MDDLFLRAHPAPVLTLRIFGEGFSSQCSTLELLRRDFPDTPLSLSGFGIRLQLKYEQLPLDFGAWGTPKAYDSMKVSPFMFTMIGVRYYAVAASPFSGAYVFNEMLPLWGRLTLSSLRSAQPLGAFRCTL